VPVVAGSQKHCRSLKHSYAAAEQLAAADNPKQQASPYNNTALNYTVTEGSRKKVGSVSRTAKSAALPLALLDPESCRMRNRNAQRKHREKLRVSLGGSKRDMSTAQQKRKQ
jgi:hypothetical protein